MRFPLAASFTATGFGAMAALTACSAPASAEDYVIDGGHTHVLFKIERFGLSNTIGSFADVKGVIHLDEAAPEKTSVEATIGIASLKSDNPAREQVVIGPHWLDAAQYPEMTFKSTKVERTGEKTAKMTGDLTLHGVTKPVTLDVTLHGMGTDPVTKHKAAGFSAMGHVDRTDFRINTAAGLIGTDVTIMIEVLGVADR